MPYLRLDSLCLVGLLFQTSLCWFRSVIVGNVCSHELVLVFSGFWHVPRQWGHAQGESVNAVCNALLQPRLPKHCKLPKISVWPAVVHLVGAGRIPVYACSEHGWEIVAEEDASHAWPRKRTSKSNPAWLSEAPVVIRARCAPKAAAWRPTVRAVICTAHIHKNIAILSSETLPDLPSLAFRVFRGHMHRTGTSAKHTKSEMCAVVVFFASLTSRCFNASVKARINCSIGCSLRASMFPRAG